MNIQRFISGQVDAANRTIGVFDHLHKTLIEADAPPECIAYVEGQLRAIFDQHSATAMHDGSDSATAAALAAVQLFRPIVADLTTALVAALAAVWYAGPDAVESLRPD